MVGYPEVLLYYIVIIAWQHDAVAAIIIIVHILGNQLKNFKWVAVSVIIIAMLFVTIVDTPSISSTMSAVSDETTSAFPSESVHECQKIDKDSHLSIQTRHLVLLEYIHMGEKRQLRILQGIAGKWKRLGTLFGYDVDRIAQSYTSGPDYVEECCRAVLNDWLSRGAPGYPISWNSLIKALKDIELLRNANDLEVALQCVTSII